MNDISTILRLPIDAIYVDHAKLPLPLDMPGALALGAKIKADGQLDPIAVRRRGNRGEGRAEQPYQLIDGLRRLEGMRAAGFTEIAAIVTDCRSDDVTRLNVAFNLDRRACKAIELAILIGVRWEMAEAARPEGQSRFQASIAARWAARSDTLDIVSDISGENAIDTSPETALVSDWASHTAAILGCSRAKVYNYRKIYEAIVEPFRDLVPAILAHEVGDNLKQLSDIAKTDLGRRRHDLERALRSGEKRPTVEQPKRQYSDGFDYKWAKATVDEQRALAREVIRGTRLKVVPVILAEAIHDTSLRKQPAGLIAEALKMLPDSGVGFLRDSIASLSVQDREAVIAEFRLYGARRIK